MIDVLILGTFVVSIFSFIVVLLIFYNQITSFVDSIGSAGRYDEDEWGWDLKSLRKMGLKAKRKQIKHFINHRPNRKVNKHIKKVNKNVKKNH